MNEDLGAVLDHVKNANSFLWLAGRIHVSAFKNMLVMLLFSALFPFGDNECLTH